MPVTEKRTQLYLTARQHAALVRMARDRRTSLAGVIRQAIDAFLRVPAPPDRVAETADPLADLIGCFDGPGDLAENHDDHLYGAAEALPIPPRRRR